MTEKVLNFIDGHFVEGASTFDDINPVDGSVVAQVHAADERVVDDAVRGARSALGGPGRE